MNSNIEKVTKKLKTTNVFGFFDDLGAFKPSDKTYFFRLFPH